MKRTDNKKKWNAPSITNLDAQKTESGNTSGPEGFMYTAGSTGDGLS